MSPDSYDPGFESSTFKYGLMEPAGSVSISGKTFSPLPETIGGSTLSTAVKPNADFSNANNVFTDVRNAPKVS